MKDITKTVMKLAAPHKRDDEYRFGLDELLNFAERVFVLGRDLDVMRVKFKPAKKD